MIILIISFVSNLFIVLSIIDIAMIDSTASDLIGLGLGLGLDSTASDLIAIGLIGLGLRLDGTASDLTDSHG